MLLYKFKGGSDALYALDIAIHERLYCARYSELNDPFEGQFRASLKRGSFFGGAPINGGVINGNSEPTRAYFDALELLEGDYSRVCSLTAAYYDVRMWALYGDSSRGVVFEFDVPDNHPSLHQVRYSPTLPDASLGLLSPTSAAEILSSKTDHWRYEQEWRFITNEATSYIELPGKLRRVMIGHRAPMAVQEALLKVSPAYVTVHRVSLDPRGVRLEPDAALPRPNPPGLFMGGVGGETLSQEPA